MVNFLPNLMSQKKHSAYTLAVYSLLVSVSAFVTGLAFILNPSDPDNNIFLGFSMQSLVLIGGVLFAGIVMAGGVVRAYKDQAWAAQVGQGLFGSTDSIQRTWILLGSGLIVLSLMPQYRFGDFQGYFARLHPLIIWLAFISWLTFGVIWVEYRGFPKLILSSFLHAHKKALGVALISMTIFALVWVFIAWTGLGTRVSEDYWYGSGVPILGLQVLLAFAIGIGVFLLEKSLSGIRLPAFLDLLIFALVWGVAAFLWAHEPLQPSYFVPHPYPPNYEYYPYSDAASNFDILSQFALIGQGYNNGFFFERALYVGFLLLLHVLVGQEYAQVVTLQAVIFAVLPGILYLLGKAIHRRSFGVILAVLAILRGINGIAASNLIDSASQKQMMSDFPVAILVAGFALMAVKWLKAPNKNYLYGLWAGGIIGLAIMVRTHALFLVLVAIFLAAIAYRNQKLRGLLVSTLLLMTLFASMMPWEVHSGVSVFDGFMIRIRATIGNRYHSIPDPLPTPTPQGNSSSSLSFVSWIPETGDADLITSLPLRESGVYPSSFSASSSLINVVRGEIQVPFLLRSITTNFLHNIVTSVFILPTSPVFHDLRHTVKTATPFWQQYWDGRLGIGAGFFFLFNLLMIALGIGVSWKSAGLSALIPLGSFLFYNLANAFARTSGGRYITPVDWVVIFYFALGLLQIILWGMVVFGLKGNLKSQDETEEDTWSWKPMIKAPGIILFFLLIGTSLPLSEHFFPRRYPVQSQAELLTTVEREGYLQEIGFNSETLKSLSAQPDFMIITGRALYPRYFSKNKGLSKRTYPYQVMGFPRIAFTMIGPSGISNVVLPLEESPDLPNASDVIVLGCQQADGGINALVVVVIAEKRAVYTRQPQTALGCP